MRARQWVEDGKQIGCAVFFLAPQVEEIFSIHPNSLNPATSSGDANWWVGGWAWCGCMLWLGGLGG